jgi:hypothetical protein
MRNYLLTLIDREIAFYQYKFRDVLTPTVVIA